MASPHTVILMYHALYASPQDLARIELEDRPYAVSLDTFRAQLDALKDAGLTVLHPRALASDGPPPPGVLITFDDGHVSNFELAWPELQRRGLVGLFFVTSQFMGHKPGFCSWTQLKTMSDQGMVIGGHGHTHRFFTDMSEAEAREELRLCKTALEQHIGPGPHQMSFPGGRFKAEHLGMARQEGFAGLHTSRVALADAPKPSGSLREWPRMAIRASTSLGEFRQIIQGHALYYLRAQAMWRVKNAIKALLGDGGYHTVYKAVKK